MPVVPFAPQPPKGRAPQAPIELSAAEEPWVLMAAAQMHSEGRLLEHNEKLPYAEPWLEHKEILPYAEQLKEHNEKLPHYQGNFKEKDSLTSGKGDKLSDKDQSRFGDQ